MWLGAVVVMGDFNTPFGLWQVFEAMGLGILVKEIFKECGFYAMSQQVGPSIPEGLTQFWITFAWIWKLLYTSLSAYTVHDMDELNNKLCDQLHLSVYLTLTNPHIIIKIHTVHCFSQLISSHCVQKPILFHYNTLNYTC